MICDTKSTQKQIDGLLIASVCFNPNYSCIEHSITSFNKSILNPVLQTIQQIIGASDIFTDVSTSALLCLQQILKIVYKTYDVKVH
jgi:hypothetical protein